MIACVVTTPFGRPVVPLVYDHGAALGADVRQLFSRLDAQRVGRKKSAAILRDGRQNARRSRAADDHVRAGVADDILEFRCRMGNREWYGDAASSPNPTLCDCVSIQVE